MATKWIVLYYTFFFLFGGYALLQIVCTALVLLLTNTEGKAIELSGFNATIDGLPYFIWDLPEFYIATILSSTIISTMIILTTKLIMFQDHLGFLGLRKIKREHYKWLFYSAMVLLSGTALLELVGVQPSIEIEAANFWKKVLLVAGLVLFAPFFEELLFRGYLLSRMSLLLSPKFQWVAIVLTSLLFAVLHLQYDIFIMVYILGIGIFLSIMKLKTNNLWLPIIFHVAGNFIAAYPILFG